MDLENFEFEGYHYDPNTISECGSVFYEKDGDEDSWLEIIPVAKSDELYVILTVDGCRTVKAGLYQRVGGRLVERT